MRETNEVGTAPTAFDQPIAEQIWRSKYQYNSNGRTMDMSLTDTWLRVASNLAQSEHVSERNAIASEFYEAMDDFKLLPAGRILSGCGTARNVTLSNTFVMRTLEDSVSGIMDVAKDAALTMKMGGGIGFDFSTIRPQGMIVLGLDCPAAGPLGAMDIFDAVCKMLVTGMGRGAMMGTLRCDHPDIEAFIKAKADPARLRNFNLSVMITDPFMEAVEADADWDLIWNGKVVRTTKARHLWETIMRQAYDTAEPGVLFIDRINAKNPLGYLEEIAATNSCAEQPLPPNGTCPLASINLAKLVSRPFSKNAMLDKDEMQRLVSVAVRMLDNVIDRSQYAVDAQRQEAQSKRRIGIGVTGVGDALIMLGLRYGSDAAVYAIEDWMRAIQNAAYMASAKLAKERGAFPAYNKVLHHYHASLASLDDEVRNEIAKYGLRNGALTSIAPTGTISMLGGNVSSGIEPVFATSYNRSITRSDGSKELEKIECFSAREFGLMFGESASLPDAFITTQDLTPEDHINMQAAAQKWIDGGISKTVNCPEDIAFASFQDIYKAAYVSGCKGCTTYRPNAVTGSVLST